MGKNSVSWGMPKGSFGVIPNAKLVLGSYPKLRKIRENLIDTYHREFLVNLMGQAIDKRDRYRPVNHESLCPGDVVLLVNKHLKQYQYPMGRVLTVEKNSLGVATSAKVKKGGTNEVVFRHATSLILLVPFENKGLDCIEEIEDTSTPPSIPDVGKARYPKRKSHQKTLEKIKSSVESQ